MDKYRETHLTFRCLIRAALYNVGCVIGQCERYTCERQLLFQSIRRERVSTSSFLLTPALIQLIMKHVNYIFHSVVKEIRLDGVSIYCSL